MARFRARTLLACGHARDGGGQAGAETFLKELVWRDFAYHLVYHTPHIVERNWREDWDGVPVERPMNARRGARWRAGARACRCRRGDARDVRDRADAQPRADAGRLLPDQAPDEPLEDRLAWFEDCLSTGIRPRTRWAGSGRRARGPTRRPISGSSTPRRRPRSSTSTAATAAPGWRNCHRPPPETALSYFEAIPRSWGMAPGDGLSVGAGGECGPRGASARWRPMKTAGSDRSRVSLELAPRARSGQMWETVGMTR
jgi:deoxyribodipyrimidine photo-lyase